VSKQSQMISNAIPVANGSEPIWALEIQSLSDVKPEPVRWIVKGPDGGGIIPAGLTVFCGDPGAGKSTLTRAIISAITIGGNDQFQTEGSEVLVLCWEDDASSIFLPHILCCGGDPRRVHLVKGIRSDIGSESNWAPANLGLVRAHLQRHPNIKLVVADVLATLTSTGGRDSHNGEDIRGLLMPLQSLGQEMGVGFLMLHHQNKRTGERALTRVSGSIQISGTARLVWMIAVDPDNPDLRQMAFVKGNIPGKSDGFVFGETSVDLASVEKHAKQCGIQLPPELDLSLFHGIKIYEGPPTSADELARGISKQGQENAKQKADIFLRERIKQLGEAQAKKLEQEAKSEGIGKTALEQAKKKMKEAGHIRYQKRGSEWWLIGTAPQGATIEAVFG
jgi:hypothetical protein